MLYWIRVLGVLILAALFTDGIAQKLVYANTESDVPGLDGGFPYKLVVEDADGPSQRQPGIYVRGEDNGTWKLALSGAFLEAPKKGGPSLLLEMTKKTHRYEAVGVLNGRITIFSIESKEDQPDSFVQIDSVVDPVDHSEIQMPPITDIQSVLLHSLYPSDFFGSPLPIVLASLKVQNLKGTGLTIAFVVDTKSVNGELKLLYKPIILDWKFRQSPAELSKILHSFGSDSSSVFFYSENILQAYSKQKNEDNPIIRAWKRTLRWVLGGGEQLNNEDVERLPLIGAKNAELDIQSLPYLTLQGFPVSNGNSKNTYIYSDPLSNQSAIFAGKPKVKHSEFNDLSFILKGEVEFDKQDRPNISHCKFSTTGTATLIQMADGKVFLALVVDNGMQTVRLLQPSHMGQYDKPKHVSWIGVPGTSNIIVSWDYGIEGYTVLYSMKHVNNHWMIQNTIPLQTKYFSTEELSWRLDKTEGFYIFDFYTPPSENNQDYRKKRKLTVPHIDIEETLKTNAVQEFYPATLNTIELMPDVEYMVFEDIQGRPSRTGVYGKAQSNERPKSLVLGGVLPFVTTKDGKEEKQYLLDTKEFHIEHIGKTIVSVIATDKNYAGGANNYTLHLVISVPHSKYQTSYLIADANRPFEDLKSLNILKKDDKSKDFVVAIGDRERGTLMLQVHLGAHRQMDTYSLKIEAANNRSLLRLNNEKIIYDLVQLNARVMWSKEGSIAYWVETPDLSPDHLDFSIHSIKTNERAHPNQQKMGRVEYGSEDLRYHTYGGWKAYPPSGRDDLVKRREAEKLKFSTQYQAEMLPEFKQILEDLSNHTKKPKHVVVIVPNELEDYVKNLPRVQWLKALSHSTWSVNNSRLELYMPPPETAKVTQIEVMKNFKSMKQVSEDGGHRAVFFSSLKTINDIARPTNERHDKDSFLLKESKFDEIANGEDGSVKGAPIEETVEPHIGYLVATEGERISLQDFDSKKASQQVSTLFVGTKSQWETFQDSIQFEQKYGVLDTFEIVELAPPSREVRIERVLEILRSPEIRSRNYQIDINSVKKHFSKETVDQMSQDEKERIFAEDFVIYAESLSDSNEKPIYEGFTVALQLLAKDLTNDHTIQKNRVISRPVTSRILSQKFRVPLSLESLPSDDFVRKLFRDDAALQWGKAGGKVAYGVRWKLIETAKKQLLLDDIKYIQSSAVIYGPTGTGKTALMRSYCHWLGLKEYNFKNPKENEDAGCFFLTMNDIADSVLGHRDDSESGKLSADMALKYFEDFIARNRRGVIILDDFHLVSKAREKFLSRLRALLEKKEYEAQTLDGTWVKNPTQNLQIYITMNSTQNNAKVDQFKTKGKGAGAEPSDTDRIRATLSTEAYEVDDSFLKRFGDLIALSAFPEESRPQALLDAATLVAKGVFLNSQNYFLVAPSSATGASKVLTAPDVRTFIPTGGRALIQGPPGSMNTSGSGLYIMVPKLNPENSDFDLGAKSTMTVSGNDDGEKLEKYIHQNVEPFSIENTLRGKVEFVKYLVNNYRVHAYRTLLEAISGDSNFTVGLRNQQNLGAVARAIHDHLLFQKAALLDDLNLDPVDFGAKNHIQKKQFSEFIKAEILEQNLQKLKLPQTNLPPRTDLYAEITGESIGANSYVNRTRLHVLSEFELKLTKIQERLASALFRLDSLDSLPKSIEWIKDLRSKDPELTNLVQDDVPRILESFMLEIFDAQLSEAIRKNPTMTYYDAVRFFTLIFDKAIAKLPWGKLASFLVKSIKIASSDTTLAGLPGFQYLLFESKVSPVVTSDPSYVQTLAITMPFFTGSDGKSHTRQAKRFEDTCSQFLFREDQP